MKPVAETRCERAIKSKHDAPRGFQPVSASGAVASPTETIAALSCHRATRFQTSVLVAYLLNLDRFRSFLDQLKPQFSAKPIAFAERDAEGGRSR